MLVSIVASGGLALAAQVDGMWKRTGTGNQITPITINGTTADVVANNLTVNGTCTGCGGGGGAPTDATYITQTANGTLSAEQALSSLASGIMRVATTTGVITALTDSAGIAANISDEQGTGALVLATSPTLTTPNIGVATATSVNKVAITAPATSATLTIADGATLSATASATVNQDVSNTANPAFATINVTGTNSLNLGTASTNVGQIVFKNATNAFTTTIQSGVSAASRVYTLPTDFGAAGTVLTDAAGNGTLSWAAAGGFAWGATATGASATGVTLTVDNSAAASTFGQKIIVSNTQTNLVTGLNFDLGTSTVSNRAINIDATTATAGVQAIRIDTFRGLYGLNVSFGGTLNDTTNRAGVTVATQNNAGAGLTTGVYVVSNENSIDTSARGAGVGVSAATAGTTAIAVVGGDNVNSSTNGLVNYTLSNTQSGATVVQKIDTGTSAQAQVGLLLKVYNASSTSDALQIDPSTTATGRGINFANTGGSGYAGIYWANVLNTAGGISQYGIKQDVVASAAGTGYGIYQGIISDTASGTGYGLYQGTLVSNVGATVYGIYQAAVANGGGGTTTINGYGIYQNTIVNGMNGTNTLNAYGWYVGNLVAASTTFEPTISKFFSLNNAQSAAIKARTVDAADILFSRENTATTGTIADNFNLTYFKRTNIQNGAGGTLTATGSVLKLENVATQTAGTLTDSVIPLVIVQDVDSSGPDIFFTPRATAPATCTVGGVYFDTSGAFCACTATNTWENTTATGTCS